MTEADEKPGRVLIAYDGSDHAKEAIEEAGRQLAPGREAVVVSVWEPLEGLSFVGLRGYSANIDQAIVDDAEKAARETAEEGAELARRAGFDAAPKVISGDPVWQMIVQAAEDESAGLIVLGSRGRSGVSYVLLGSVATAVAQHSKRAVLIVHPGD